MDIKEFQKKLGYFFKNEELVVNALTHSSYANENGCESYERLEFIGDAIVDFLIGEQLFRRYPDMPEGNMTRIRAILVCEEFLSKLAKKLELDKYMRLGKGAELTGGRSNPSILADLFEALIAAIYIDAGLDNTREYLVSVYGDMIAQTVSEGSFIDYKTKLQEELQKNGARNIVYELVSAEGPIHDCVFEMCVCVDGKALGKGIAKSKKTAQQLAAAEALKKIKK